GGNVHTCIRRCVININFVFLIEDPTIGEGHVRYITGALFAVWRNEMASRTMRNNPRTLKLGHKHVKNVTQTICSGTLNVRQVQPSFWGFNGRRALVIFHFFNGVIHLFVDDNFVFDFSASHVITQAPADTTTSTHADKAILWESEQTVFTVNKI